MNDEKLKRANELKEKIKKLERGLQTFKEIGVSIKAKEYGPWLGNVDRKLSVEVCGLAEMVIQARGKELLNEYKAEFDEL